MSQLECSVSSYNEENAQLKHSLQLKDDLIKGTRIFNQDNEFHMSKCHSETSSEMKTCFLMAFKLFLIRKKVVTMTNTMMVRHQQVRHPFLAVCTVADILSKSMSNSWKNVLTDSKLKIVNCDKKLK